MLIHRQGQKTRDPWVKGKRLYFTQVKAHEHGHIRTSSPCPKSYAGNRMVQIDAMYALTGFALAGEEHKAWGIYQFYSKQ